MGIGCIRAFQLCLCGPPRGGRVLSHGQNLQDLKVIKNNWVIEGQKQRQRVSYLEEQAGRAIQAGDAQAEIDHLVDDIAATQERANCYSAVATYLELRIADLGRLDKHKALRQAVLLATLAQAQLHLNSPLQSYAAIQKLGTVNANYTQMAIQQTTQLVRGAGGTGPSGLAQPLGVSSAEVKARLYSAVRVTMPSPPPVVIMDEPEEDEDRVVL